MEALMIIDDTLKIPMVFNNENKTFEYKKHYRYAYFNYVNKGIFIHDSNILILKWDVWPQEIYNQTKYNIYVLENKTGLNKKIALFNPTHIQF